MGGKLKSKMESTKKAKFPYETSTPTEIYEEALSTGNVGMCYYAYDHGGSSQRHVEWLACRAADDGQAEILKMAIVWGATDLAHLLTDATWAGKDVIAGVLREALEMQGQQEEALAAAAEGRKMYEMEHGLRAVPPEGYSFPVHIPMIEVGRMLGYKESPHT